jgi:hypothetical protein
MATKHTELVKFYSKNLHETATNKNCCSDCSEHSSERYKRLSARYNLFLPNTTKAVLPGEKPQGKLFNFLHRKIRLGVFLLVHYILGNTTDLF